MKINEDFFNETRLERSTRYQWEARIAIIHRGVIFRYSAKWFNRGDHKVALALLVTLGNKSHSDHVALLPFHVESEKRHAKGEREGEKKERKRPEHPPMLSSLVLQRGRTR